MCRDLVIDHMVMYIVCVVMNVYLYTIYMYVYVYV